MSELNKLLDMPSDVAAEHEADELRISVILCMIFVGIAVALSSC